MIPGNSTTKGLRKCGTSCVQNRRSRGLGCRVSTSCSGRSKDLHTNRPGDLTKPQLVRLDWLETEKRIREHERDVEIRLWSRVKHLGLGDAPTKYFFNIHRQNAARAQILQLRLSTREETRDQSKILCAVGKYYAELYTAQTPTAEDRQTRRDILHKVENHVSNSERTMLSALPIEKEIEDVLLSLPLNKAPRVDGISAEALRKTWPHMKQFYVNMVHKFWEEGVLAETVTEGMIRLIPKTVNKTELKDWRPLTMLNTDYKIIARILAGRLQLLLQKIVFPQQTRFIKGRQMLDNVLALWSAQDAAKTYRRKEMFVKLDFEKAYDRVVLQAQPTFYTSIIRLSATTCRKVEQFYRHFLWGYNKEGTAKRSLVRWNLVGRPKAQGGLGIRSLTDTNSSLMGKWIGSIIDEEAGTWGFALSDLVRQGRAKHHRDIVRRHYSLSDLILTRQPLHLAGTDIAKSIMTSWKAIHGVITWDPKGVAIPRYITLRDVVSLVVNNRQEGEAATKQIMAGLRELKVTQIETLWRQKEMLKRNFVRGRHNEQRRAEGSLLHEFLHRITLATGLCNTPLRLSAGWKIRDKLIKGNFTDAARNWYRASPVLQRESVEDGAWTRNTIDKAISQWRESSADPPQRQWLEIASILQNAIAISIVTRIERWLKNTLARTEGSEGGSEALCTERAAIGLNEAPPLTRGMGEP
ncbi:hypothetical protein AXG93_815s1460 [Marchantia polymorpha subsp. ruderalis]|uniref:Reverse transcriptase domain-containing protein n=1 Tax=Marchantia polymorpha subsp. ruderalis TaxID=1480154 RepID=A0A176W1J9_MARPO|nr:hypothetical protein AXG93_815s1460 [Marchantia polymorpha subsp. ruderalis]